MKFYSPIGFVDDQIPESVHCDPPSTVDILINESVCLDSTQYEQLVGIDFNATKWQICKIPDLSNDVLYYTVCDK